MLNLRDDYKKNLVRSLEYLVNRDQDFLFIDSGNEDQDYLNEVEDTEFHRSGGFSHIVILCGKSYKVFIGMSLSDAQFILNNIDYIDYVYNYDMCYDTLFFDDFKSVLSDNHILGYKYILFTLGLNEAPTELEATTFFNDRRNKYDS